MRILLDTHIALWALTDDQRLTKRARELLARPGSSVYFSVASLWEIAIKSGLGRLTFSPGIVGAELASIGVHRLGIEDPHLDRLAQLPRHHRDPFDRLLIAQAEAESLKLVTADSRLKAYAGSVIVV